LDLYAARYFSVTVEDEGESASDVHGVGGDAETGRVAHERTVDGIAEKDFVGEHFEGYVSLLGELIVDGQFGDLEGFAIPFEAIVLCWFLLAIRVLRVAREGNRDKGKNEQ